jgi:hypothetical protein
MNNTLIVSRDLDKTQRDLSDANQALAAYWGRGLADTDYTWLLRRSCEPSRQSPTRSTD